MDLMKWTKTVKGWQKALLESARFAAWHNVSSSTTSLTIARSLMTVVICFNSSYCSSTILHI